MTRLRWWLASLIVGRWLPMPSEEAGVEAWRRRLAEAQVARSRYSDLVFIDRGLRVVRAPRRGLCRFGERAS